MPCYSSIELSYILFKITGIITLRFRKKKSLNVNICQKIENKIKTGQLRARQFEPSGMLVL